MTELTVLNVHSDERIQQELTALLGSDAVLHVATLDAGIIALSDHPHLDVIITGDDTLGQTLQEHCRLVGRDVSRLVVDDGLCEEARASLLARADVFLLIQVPLLREHTILAVRRARERVALIRQARTGLLTVRDAAGELPLDNGLRATPATPSAPLPLHRQELDDLMMVTAHEIRSPLSVMVGYAHVLRGIEGGLAANAVALVDRIQTTGDRLLEKVNKYLGLATLESGAVPLNCAPTKLSELLNAVVGDFLGLIETRRIGLSVNVAGDEHNYLLDRDKVESVIQNLLSNAIKFTEPGSSIDINCSGRPELIECSVADTGCGMDERQVRVAFDKFTRPPDQAVESTGLGLAIARSIVRLHGGDIWVQSEKGKGSTFTFTLKPQTET